MNKKIGSLSFTSLKIPKRVLLLICSLYVVFFLIQNSRKCSIGFISGYVAAVGLVQGEDIKTYYSNDEFAELVGRVCSDTYDIYSPNPPTYSLMMLPLVALDYPTAKVVWTILNLLMLGLIAWLMKENLSRVGWVEIFLFMLLFQPIYANLRFGQNYIFILLMVTMIWVGWKKEKPWMMVLGLVLMTGFKLGLVWLWPLLLLNGKWKQILIAGISLSLIFMLSLPFIGLEAWSVFINELSGVSSKNSGSVTAFQAIPGFFRHLFTFDPVWNQGPLFEQSFLGGTFYKLLSLLLVAFSLIVAKLSQTKNLKIALLVIVSVITSPFTLDYHYPVLIISFLLVFETLEGTRQQVLFFVAYLCIALPLPYTSDLFEKGYWSLLAYPKLYGAVILMALCLQKMISEIAPIRRLQPK